MRIKNISDFVRQKATNSAFTNGESWLVLSEIEQRIKHKIETAGIPLKNWDINIYRGILTGYNEAFIISSKKKQEILANCQTIEEREKTDKLIRPILRGRDIKKYGYDFADLWLINTHNGLKEKGIKPIYIDDYPSIKNHLNGYYSELLKRTDKGDTPYNLRNCAYIDDFSKQKIVWGEISDRTKFSIDIKGEFLNEATTFLMVGDSLIYLLGYLNSKLSEWVFSKIATTTGVGTVRWKKFTIEQLPVPQLDKVTEKYCSDKMLKIIKFAAEKRDYNNLEKEFNYEIYRYIGLSNEEIDFIETQ